MNKNSFLFGLSMALVLVMPQPVRAAEELACQARGDCVVQGAEVDDEATLAARKIVGTGPTSGIASDRRIKGDAKQVGELPNGIKVYSFRFLWEERTRVGLMAQDLMERDNEKSAVVILSNGLLGIDYGRLDLRMATDAEWLKDGPAALKAGYGASTSKEAKDADPVVLYNKRPKS
jgi:hypothetical protein